MAHPYLYRLITLIVAAAIGLQGCAGQPTTAQCEAMGNADNRLACLDQVMFGRVAAGAAIGAAGGAILGGAILFAATRGRSFAAGMVVGGMVGGVTGGLIAYLQDKQLRAGGQVPRMVADIRADLRADNRHVDALLETSNQIQDEASRRLGAMEEELAAARRNGSYSNQEIGRLRRQSDDLKSTNEKLLQMVADLKQTLQVYRAVVPAYRRKPKLTGLDRA